MDAPTLSLQNLNEVQGQNLIDSIRCGECILVLGPYANVAKDDRAERVRLANHLAQRLPTSPPLGPAEQDSFSSVVCRILLDSKYNSGDIVKEIGQFHQQQPRKIVPDSPYDLVLDLGFRTIFSTDPDSRLMRAFNDRNRNPLGLYFTQCPQADIVPFYGSADGLTATDDDTPVIINLFGLRDRPDSLAIGPEKELSQLYALTSGEMRDKINVRIAPRLARCRWYLFVGFNFNSWALGSIFYFFSKLTEKIKEARVFGLHSKPQAELTDSTVVYYKNLFPNERNKDDVRIVHSDAKGFFRELSALAERFPPPPPPVSQVAFVVYHPKDRDRLDSLRAALETKCQEYDLTVLYSQPVTAFDTPLTDEQRQHHTLTDPVVFFLLSTHWDDFQYDPLLDLARQREATSVQGLLLDGYNLFGPNRRLKPAFDDGAIKLLNGQRPLTLPGDLNGVMRGIDAFLEDTLIPA